ncbi:MAG: hypothetical protein II956_00935 [Bacteroidales bacterium]|nr:hypothetical protein [Bacteroidales bacterium]
MEKTAKYSWKFSKIGGVTRVSIESGDDIKHLPELDTKMWTVLSSPASGLEFDQKTLNTIDIDKDGKIRVDEVVKISQWLCNVVSDPEILVQGQKSLKLSDIRQDTDEGKKILKSAQVILKNLKSDKQEITLEDTADMTKIFAGTAFNGDGIITALSTENADLKAVIAMIGEKIGTLDDRSGEKGVNKDQIEEFYKELTDYAAWKKAGLQDGVLSYGDNTAAALDSYNAVKEKVKDYFVRCKMVAFNKDTYAAMEIPVEELAKITSENLSEKISELAKYPIARVTDKNELPLNESINPAWEAAFNKIKTLIFDVDFKGKTSITESEFNAIASKFAAYEDWMSKKAGAKVDGTDLSEAEKMLSNSSKDELLNLIDKDLAYKEEAEDIISVDNLLHCTENFYPFLRNFVTFSDFYTIKHEKWAMFQAGKLFIDQRECDLCIKVSDMPKHNATANQSAMFLIYCDCTNKVLNQTMQICAAVTDGSVDDIKVGKNAIFIDRAGNLWDATVNKVIENPISIREAFWAPYKKFVSFIEEQVTKFAASKDKEMTDKATASITEGGTKLTEKSAAAADTAATEAKVAEAQVAEATSKKEAFDIAKYCGIFAAIGMALGLIGSFVVSLVTGFISLKWWQMILAVLAIMLIISGPSMLLAYLKLRRRNLSPLLNANGWAVNAQAFVNIMFGATLTHLAKFPRLRVKDPLADKGYPKWKIALWILLALSIIGFVLYCNGGLHRFGLDPIPLLDFTDKAAAATETAPQN